jgi:predicted transcriptional regulator
MKLSDLRTRDDEWRGIEALLQAGGRPKLENVLKALGTEEAIPPRSRAHIASLLRKKQKRTGRKAVPDGEFPADYKFRDDIRRTLRMFSLMFEVQSVANELKTADPLEDAIKKIAARRNIAAGTVRRYYLKACKETEVIDSPHEI